MSRPTSRRFLTALAAAIAAPASAWTQPQADPADLPVREPPPPQTEPVTPDADPAILEALAALINAGAPEAARIAAARDLTARIADPASRRAILGILRSPPEDESARWVMVRALSREHWLPDFLLPDLLDLIPAAEGDRLARLLGAIAVIRTPDALHAIADLLDPPAGDASRAAAASALLRATGREDIPPTRQAWREWIQTAHDADGTDGLRPSWNIWILRGLSDRSDRLATRSRDLTARLTDSNRRLYVVTPSEQRPALLVTMLRDDLPEIRTLGFELLERELVATPIPHQDVVNALIALLGNATPSVRTQAAVFLGRIAPDAAADAVAAALGVEQDPTAAAALLTAAARWPRDEIRTPVLRWLENGPATRPVASEAALAMHRAGRWSAQDIDRIAAAMRRVRVTDLTPPGCRLIAAIGTNEDRDSLSQLLEIGSSVQRAVVADALASRSAHLDQIIAAAHRDANLISAAARAVAAHRPDLAGFRALARIPTTDEAARRSALRTVGEVLSIGDLLGAADLVGGDTATMLWLLERALARSQLAVATGEPGSEGLLREAAERLARQRLELGRPAEAIAALDAAPDASPSSRLTALRTIALLILGRIQDARDLGAGPDAWLDGLERTIFTAQAPEILQTIQEHFAESLTPAQANRLDALARRIPQSAPEEPAPTTPG